jgi:uncharacterized SAM-binding protein YcdF (DUF218 family)
MRTLRLAVKAGLVLLALGMLYVGVTFVQVWLAARADDAPSADAIVVMGAAQYNGKPSPVFAGRLDHSVELYDGGLADWVVVTGGRREGDEFTEASAAAGYLIARGVPESAMLLESSGENSWQSLAAAARILRDRDLTEVILVSDPYHSLRIRAIADEVGLEPHVSPATGSSSFSRLLKETAAVSVGRVIGFDRLVRLDDRVERVRARSRAG